MLLRPDTGFLSVFTYYKVLFTGNLLILGLLNDALPPHRLPIIKL
jgi:hypothetical protein